MRSIREMLRAMAAMTRVIEGRTDDQYKMCLLEGPRTQCHTVEGAVILMPTDSARHPWRCFTIIESIHGQCSQAELQQRVPAFQIPAAVNQKQHDLIVACVADPTPMMAAEAKARRERAPFTFIAFGLCGRQNEKVAQLYYPPTIPARLSLDRLQREFGGT